MSSDNYKTIVLSLPAAALLTISQAAIGCGIGILLADKVTENRRNTAAIGMLCSGDRHHGSGTCRSCRRYDQWAAVEARGSSPAPIDP